MNKDPRQVHIDILTKLIGKELSETLQKENIEAWIEEFSVDRWYRIVFQKVVRVSYRRHLPNVLESLDLKDDEYIQFKKDSLETIKRETYNLKADFPGMVQDAVAEFKTRKVQYN